jgi:signal transduction histidine kinase
MSLGAYASSRGDAERTIAAARVALACSSLFAVWLDPAEPARFAQLTYTVHVVYVTYAAALAAYVWRRTTGESLPVVTHLADIAAFSVFQFLTLGPSSPFFIYFVFSLFCAAIRWGWQGTLWTAGIVLSAYLFMTAWMTRTLGPGQFELNRAIVRTVYLIVTAWLLVYLGRYEQRLRDEIERLARWPSTAGATLERATEQVMQHGAQIVGARRAVVLWEAGEEPVVNLGTWTPERASLTKHAPDELDRIVPPGLEHATFICPGTVRTAAPLLVSSATGMRSEAGGLTLPSALHSIESSVGLASARFETDRVSGRVFFGDLGTPAAEIVPLTEIVAREIGSFLDQVYVTQQLAAIAASEERIRVARDLHDGVLQSLTGIRLEMRAVGSTLDESAATARDRLFAIERAVAIEQRELRLFIEDLGPPRPAAAAGRTLAERLEALRERIALEWKAPVAIRVNHEVPELPEDIADAVPLMVHEAIVNALKHAAPSRVVVDIDGGPDEVRIVVSDDGHGFSFHGRYDHAALAEMQTGPRSLLDRVASLGGRMSIDSSDAGSRVEMRLAL